MSAERGRGRKKGKAGATGRAGAEEAALVQTIDAAPASGKAEGQRIAVSEHPRASRFVRQAHEAAGLGGFLLGGWMSLHTHTLADALLRALVAGVACQMVVWAAAVMLCRHLIVAEIKSREDALMKAAAARLEASRRGANAVPAQGRARSPIQGRARP